MASKPVSATATAAAAAEAARKPCARFTPHLWLEGRCKCQALKEAHSLSALQAASHDAAQAVWYPRPSEILRQRGGRPRGPSLSSGNVPRPGSEAAAAAAASSAAPAGHTPATPALHPYARYRAALRRVNQSAGAILQPAAASAAAAAVAEEEEQHHAHHTHNGSVSVADLRSRVEEEAARSRGSSWHTPPPHPRFSRSSSKQNNMDGLSSSSPSPAPFHTISEAAEGEAASAATAESGSGDATGSSADAKASAAPTPAAPIVIRVTPALSVVPASSITGFLQAATPHSHSSSSALQLLEEHFDGSQSNVIVDRARSPPPVLHHEGGSGVKGHSRKWASAGGPLSPASQASLFSSRGGGSAGESVDTEGSSQKSDSDTEDAGSDAGSDKELDVVNDNDNNGAAQQQPKQDDDDDEDDSTESGMSAAEIAALLARLGGGPSGGGRAPPATVTFGAHVANSSALQPATKKPLKGILIPRRRSSSSGRPRRGAAVTNKKTRHSVSFSSAVRVREFGRMQGGSTSVTRSGAFSLGLDWDVQRETLAPLELSIDTIAERRKRAEELAEQQQADADAAVTALDDGDDAVLLTEAEDAVGSTSAAAGDAAVQVEEVEDDISVEAYRSQELRVHRRYPSNNKSEELKRIGEDQRLELFRNYVGCAASAPPTPLSSAVGGNSNNNGIHHDDDVSDDQPSAALAAVLLDPAQDYDEGHELDLIRSSRGGNFCSCHPPRGRLKAMLMDLPRDAIDALPLSKDNTCCSDDSCACFRAGVGCHVESDHYCACAGSFVELLPKKKVSRRSAASWNEASEREEGDGDNDDEEAEEEMEEEEEEEEEEQQDDDDDCEDGEERRAKPLPLAQAGCLNPAGRYQFDQRAAGEHVQKFLYAPWGEEEEEEEEQPTQQEQGSSGLMNKRFSVLTSPPVRFARARTASAMPSFHFRPSAAATAASDADAASVASMPKRPPAFVPQLSAVIDE